MSGDPEERISVSETRWPIVDILLRPGFTLEDIDAAYDKLEQIARRGQPHIHWTDLCQLRPLEVTALVRKHAAEREKRFFAVAKGAVVADVRVVRDPAVRGLIKAFEWLAGATPWPMTAVPSDEEGHQWLQERDALTKCR